MNQEIEAIEAVSRAVDRLTVRGRFLDFELSNGIILTIKSVPPLLIQGVTKEFEPPPPPKVFIEEKGREEENPSDPSYTHELERLLETQNIAITNMVLAMGTSAKFVPEGYFKPEDEGWVEQVQYAASITGKTLTIDKTGIKRYLCWLRFYALETAEDVIVLNNLPTMLGGIREDEVGEIVEFFRSLPERGTNSSSTPPVGNQNGNTGNRASRRAGARNRGA